MNFLQLCQRVRQECAISGTGPSTVVSQTGELKRIVDWTASAWDDIQTHRTGWDWMRGTYSFSTVAGTDTYTAATAGIASRFGYWDKDIARIYSGSVSDEVELYYLPYEDWRHIYRVGEQTQSRPRHWTVMPNMSLGLGFKPDAVYVVSGEYGKSNQSLTVDADTPELPSQYHMAIVYRAMMMYARYSAAAEIYDDAQMNYKRILTQLDTRHAPEFLDLESLI